MMQIKKLLECKSTSEWDERAMGLRFKVTAINFIARQVEKT